MYSDLNPWVEKKGDGFVFMSNAAQGPTSTPMAGFSFPSFYYRKELKVF